MASGAGMARAPPGRPRFSGSSSRGLFGGGGQQMRRSESAPVLAPVWEPPAHEGAAEEEEEEEPAFLRSMSYGGADFDEERRLDAAALADLLAPHFPRGLLPEAWRTLLEQLSSGASASSSPLAQSELVAAAQESLRSGAAPLELRSGLVDKCYTMRRELASGSGFKVMEGVERRGGSDSAAKPEAQRNFSIKIISLPSRKLSRQKADKASKPLDPMQAFYLICSFVDEVFSHPNFIAVVMKWGMHEVDASHQLSSWIAESLSLLRELLPAERRSRCYLRFSARELQRVLLRSSCLDLYLQTHLFIQ